MVGLFPLLSWPPLCYPRWLDGVSSSLSPLLLASESVLLLRALSPVPPSPPYIHPSRPPSSVSSASSFCLLHSVPNSSIYPPLSLSLFFFLFIGPSPQLRPLALPSLALHLLRKSRAFLHLPRSFQSRLPSFITLLFRFATSSVVALLRAWNTAARPRPRPRPLNRPRRQVAPVA